MERRRRTVLALLVTAATIALPLPTLDRTVASEPVEHPSLVATGALGSTTAAAAVDRSSVKLDATYDADLRISWRSRVIVVDSTATIRNASGAAIDRVELNTIAAKLGGMRLKKVTVDGGLATATVKGQTISVPLGRNLAANASTSVRVRYRATLRSNLAGSNWLFTRANGIVDLYRWLPWVSRRTPFERPNHGDPFVTPSSRSVTVRIETSRRLVLATSGTRTSISPDGLRQAFVATNMRDFTVTAARDYLTRSRVVRDSVVRVYYRPGAPGPAMLDAAADAFEILERKLGPYPHRTFKVVQSAGAFGMESPGLIWIPTGVGASNLRYLAAHETAHQWFYGVVGNDQARAPFADEAAADFAARHVLRLRRSSRCAEARLDRSIYRYSEACYYETVYIQGGNLLNAARKAMGAAPFWPALRRYVADNRNGIATTRTLLDTLDAATSVNLARRLFAARFPRIY